MSHRLRTLLLALLAFTALESRAAEPLPLRLMTYNIRLDLASDGANAWPHRKDWVAEQINWLRPDIFGLQEVLPHQKADLAASLPGYQIIGGGRDDGAGKGEASPLGFDPRKFRLLDSGLFWLSATPTVPSKGWDAAYNRVVTWARLRVAGSKQVVLVINTHWDHIGLVARRESAAQISRWIEANARRCERVLLFGDFNSLMSSEQMQALVSSGRLHDARALSKTPAFGPDNTFNGFKDPPAEKQIIDHFLLGEGVEVQRYLVLSQTIEGLWPSDHFPVLIDVTLPACR